MKRRATTAAMASDSTSAPSVVASSSPTIVLRVEARVVYGLDRVTCTPQSSSNGETLPGGVVNVAVICSRAWRGPACSWRLP